jgi:Right handed beta helix region
MMSALGLTTIAMNCSTGQRETLRRVEGLFAPSEQLEQRLAKTRRQVDKLTPSLLVRDFAGKAGVSGLMLLLCVSSGLPLAATDYFVRNKGDDESPGNSASAAWRTIDRVNHARFQPGDRVLFEAATAFPGNLCFSAEDAGTSNAPVVISSFGEGRATILAGGRTGITIENAAGFVIENLIIRGAGRTNNAGYGIRCDNTLTNAQRLAYLRIANVEAFGFGIFGILITGNHAGYEHVCITNCVVRDNLRGGMEVAGRLAWDSPEYAHANVHVTHCQAFDNTGDPSYLKNHSGSGIVLYQVDGGIMEYCTAWNNGGLCHSSGGGVGLWTCASRRVVIQHCESFANQTSGADGGGFDIDGGCEDCVLQYNYSHDNDGPGLMVYSYSYAAHSDRGNVVRFNISENDSRKGRRYAGLWVRTDGKEMTGLEIYNNTVVIGPWTDQAARVYAPGVEAHLRNNIFIATVPALPLRVEPSGERVRFENNLYWCEGGPTQIAWGAQIYSSLPEWRDRTGQEMLSGERTGLFANPALSHHPPEVRPGERRELQALRAFRPRPGSPALAAGLDLRAKFGLDTGAGDFLGLLPRTGRFPIGAIGIPALD